MQCVFADLAVILHEVISKLPASIETNGVVPSALDAFIVKFSK